MESKSDPPARRAGSPINYHPPEGVQTSPHKLHKLDNYDPRKLDFDLPPQAAKYDRKLQEASSMGTTVLIDFERFIREVLPSGRDIPELNARVVKDATNKLKDLFPESKGAGKVPEDEIVHTLVDIFNSMDLPNGYSVASSQYKADESDTDKAKVDAALYPNDCAPTDGRPSWTHCRLYIEFKQGDIGLDPFDDRENKAPEPVRDSRAAVRVQLIAYAHKVYVYQHRIGLFALFIIGDEFRVMRFDRSGIVVSKKVKYSNDPTSLLRFVWHIAHLSDEEQGLDPSASLIQKGSSEDELMRLLAKGDEKVPDLDYNEGDVVPPYEPLTPSTEQRTAANMPTPRGRNAQARKSTAAVSSDESEAREGAGSDHAEASESQGDPRVFSYVRKKFRESLVKGFPRYKLEVGPRKRIFLVAKPIFASSSMFGRGTRGYVAIDYVSQRFVFLKDSWRPYYVGVEQEGHYLEMLASSRLTDLRVPTVVCHGDVRDQQAFAAIYEGKLTELLARANAAKKKQEEEEEEERRARRSASKASKSAAADNGQSKGKKRRRAAEDGGVPDVAAGGGRKSEGPNVTGEVSSENEDTSLRHQIHYRIAVNEVCLPFDQFTSSKQLVEILYNCLVTHFLAYKHHRLLHRDISVGNILILPTVTTDESTGEMRVDWYGILTDWELAKVVPKDSEDEHRARQPERTGTWQFMSVAYVEGGCRNPVGIPDELESLFHVLLFQAVRFIPHNIDNTPTFVINYFDRFNPGENFQRACSDAKNRAVRNGTIGYSHTELQFKTSGTGSEPRQHHLNALMGMMLPLFQARYRVIDWERSKSKSPVTKFSNTKAGPSPVALPSTGGRTPKRKVTVKDEFWLDSSESDDEALSLQLQKQEPPKATYDQSALLNSHREFLKLFGKSLQMPEWPLSDKGDDQLPVGNPARGAYEPREVIITTLATVQRSAVQVQFTASKGLPPLAEADSEPPAAKKPKKDMDRSAESSPVSERPPSRAAGGSQPRPRSATSTGRSRTAQSRKKGKGHRRH